MKEAYWLVEGERNGRFRCREDSGRPLTEQIRRRNGAGRRGVGKRPGNMGLQFQRGLSDGDWELEERVTKKSCGAGRRSVYKVLIQAAKMEIPV